MTAASVNPGRNRVLNRVAGATGTLIPVSCVQVSPALGMGRITLLTGVRIKVVVRVEVNDTDLLVSGHLDAWDGR